MSFLGRLKGTANELIDSVSNALKVSLNDGAGNPLSSLRGAIDVHDADVHDFPVNEYFHNHTGVATTLSVASLPQDRSVTVVSAAGFAPLDYVQIQNGVTESTFPQIISIVGNVLNLDRPLDNGFAIGDTVEVVSFNMNANGSVTPVSFKLIPNQGQDWHIIRFLFSMTHSTAGDLGLFGNITPLSLPVILRRYDGATGQYSTFTSWKSNADFKDDMYDVEFDARSGGGGTYGTSGRGSIKIGTGAVPKLSGAAGDYLEVLVQADLTGLLSFKLKAQGHIVGL